MSEKLYAGIWPVLEITSLKGFALTVMVTPLHRNPRIVRMFGQERNRTIQKIALIGDLGLGPIFASSSSMDYRARHGLLTFPNSMVNEISTHFKK